MNKTATGIAVGAVVVGTAMGVLMAVAVKHKMFKEKAEEIISKGIVKDRDIETETACERV